MCTILLYVYRFLPFHNSSKWMCSCLSLENGQLWMVLHLILLNVKLLTLIWTWKAVKHPVGILQSRTIVDCLIENNVKGHCSWCSFFLRSLFVSSYFTDIEENSPSDFLHKEASSLSVSRGCCESFKVIINMVVDIYLKVL